MKRNIKARPPTETESDELVQLELENLYETRRVIGHSSVDEGDLGYMLDTASIAVFDQHKPDPAPRQYNGKLMILVWNLRLISEYVWIEGRLTEITEENRAEIH